MSGKPMEIEGNFKAVQIDLPTDATIIEYSEYLDYIGAAGKDGGLHLMRVKDKQCQGILKDEGVKTAYMTCLKHRPISKNYPVTNTFICTYSTGTVKCWNYNLSECIFTIEENRYINGLAYHPKLAKFVTVGDNKKIYLFDEDSQRQERVLSASEDKNATDGHTAAVTGARFHPRSGNELISSGQDNTIQFWDTRQPHALRKIEGVSISGEGGLDFNSAGTQFMTFSNQKEKPVRLWDYATGKEIKTIETDKYKNVPMNCGKILNSKNVFACAGGEPKILRIVDLNANKTLGLITNIAKPVTSITVSEGPEVPKFAFCAGDKIYEITPK